MNFTSMSSNERVLAVAIGIAAVVCVLYFIIHGFRRGA